MSDRRWQRTTAIGLPVCILLLGCAGAPPTPSDLESILPDAPAELMHAAPAARDALEEGLRWIVLDAPGTNATSGNGGVRRGLLEEGLRHDDLAGSLHAPGSAPETAKGGVER